MRAVVGELGVSAFTLERVGVLPSGQAVALLVTTLFPIGVFSQNTGGWIKAGDHPEDYDMGVDRSTAFTGSSSGYIKNNKLEPKGFGTYMQMFDATQYRGKRLRLSAYVKAENVEEWAGMWMRVDVGQKAAAFDNMQDRAIKGTHDWVQYTVVLNVDSKASAIAFGILLRGKGTVWIDDFSFDAVGEDVPTTGNFDGGAISSPRNLDFEGDPKGR